MRVLRNWNTFPWKWWTFHPWNCWRTGWMGSWATWSRGMSLCAMARGWNLALRCLSTKTTLGFYSISASIKQIIYLVKALVRKTMQVTIVLPFLKISLFLILISTTSKEPEMICNQFIHFKCSQTFSTLMWKNVLYIGFKHIDLV